MEFLLHPMKINSSFSLWCNIALYHDDSELSELRCEHSVVQLCTTLETVCVCLTYLECVFFTRFQKQVCCELWTYGQPNRLYMLVKTSMIKSI